MARLIAAIVLGGFLTAGCGETNYGRFSSDPPAGSRPVQADTLHFKHPIALTSIHRVDVASGNHPDILTAGVRPGLAAIKTGGPGITASMSTGYQTETTTYEFDLVTGTVAKGMAAAHPVGPGLIVKPPDSGGDTELYVTTVQEMQELVGRVAGGLWDLVSTAGKPYELRQASRYLQSVLDDVERAKSKR